MTRDYSPLRASNRMIAYNKHRLVPALTLQSRDAWALSFEASRRTLYVSQLIEALIHEWARAWEEQLGETDRRLFLESIPFHYQPRKPSIDQV